MSGAARLAATRDRARAFVQKHADASQREALAVLLGEAPPDRLLAELGRRQQAGGAIAAPNEDAPADLVSTLAALELLDAVDRLDADVAGRAVAYVVGCQRADGSWPEPAGAGAQGARRDARAWTGSIAGLLARSPLTRPSSLERAAAWLEQRWSVESVQGGAFDVISAYATLFTQLPSELADEALQWCGRELERGFRSGACDALQVARVLLGCGAPALPGAAIAAAPLAEALRAAQQPDGGWPAPEGAEPALRVRATLDALRALRLLGAEEDRC